MRILPVKRSESQLGQALLIVLLVMAVSLTVVLSIASRSITDISTTKLEEESLRAFSAAETAVEDALNNPLIGTHTGTVGDAATEPESAAQYEVTVSVDAPSVNPQQFVHPARPLSGETATFWFVGHNNSGNISCGGIPCYSGNNTSDFNVCWGNDGTDPSSSLAPAIELTIYYDPSRQATIGNFSNVVAEKDVFDPNNVRRSNNIFEPTSNCGGVSGVSMAFSTGDIEFRSFGNSGIPNGCAAVQGCLLMARAKLLYNTSPHLVGISVTDGNLPAQGIQVDATGQAGDSTRKVSVYQTYPEIPPVLDTAVFSLGGLAK
ncbi:hypothetical protein ACFL2C_03420 [Patescibacteria group bacterium]